MPTPELLCPAGSLKNMRYAFAYGADAVYAGQPRYSLRVRNNEFDLANLAIGIKEAHQLGKKFYVVSNIAPHNSKLKTYIRDLTPVVALKPDALIMSDPGLIMLVKEAFPDLPIHLSVQANAVNWATVKFWGTQGIERVILSRELSVDEIREIRQTVPEMELEVFVHGALCMAYSGRCLLSGYLNKRDPNQGTCTNACRWKYDVHEARENETGDVLAVNKQQDGAEPTLFKPEAIQSELIKPEPIEAEKPQATLGEGATTDNIYLLQEALRPDEYMPAFEDEHGTYIMNSKDLRAVEMVEPLTKMGVHSLKIEGRTKSFYYCAKTAQVYRQAIDDAVAGKPFDPKLMSSLDHLAHRGYTEGFLRRHTHDKYQNYDCGNSVADQAQFVGEVLGRSDNGFAIVDVKNKFLVGDKLELMTPKGNVIFELTHMMNKQGEDILVAPGSGHVVHLPLSPEIDLEFALVMRYLPQEANVTDKVDAVVNTKGNT